MAVLLLSSSPAFAQYQFNVLTRDNGLPHNSISTILQTRDGYLWVTTADGLARYDGVHFTVFNKANTKGLGSNRFTSLFEDREGTLWIGTAETGLVKYQNGSFKTFDIRDGLPGNWIVDVKDDADGNLTVLTTRGTARLDHERFISSTPFDESHHPHSLLIDRSGGVWVSEPEGIRRYARDGSKTFYQIPGAPKELGLVALYDDRKGSYWIGATTTDAGSFGLIKIGGDGLTAYTQKDGLPQNNIASIYEDRTGVIWLAIRDGGFCILRDGKISRITTNEGLPTNRVTNIYQDREGSLWLGTVDKGLVLLKQSFITMFSQRDGLSSDNTYSIYEDRAGSVWVGAWYGLNKIVNGALTDHPLKQELSKSNVTSIFEDADANLWVGTYGDGVRRLKDGKVTSFTAQDGLSGNNVWCIQQDSAGTIWIGATNGLNRYRDGSFTVYKVKDGLSSNDVRVIREARDGSLWIGTYGGLTRLKDGKLTVFTEKDGMSSNQVRAIYEDSDNVLWIGTYDNGLMRFADGKFTTYSTRDGLFDYGVFQILEDARSNLWMSSNRGIYRASRQELNEFAAGRRTTITSVAYGKEDGLLNTECNGGTQPAGWRTRDGRLWFPTRGGVAVIDPEKIPTNNLPPPILLESIKLDNEPIALSDYLEIPADKDSFEIDYAGLSFINPERMKFRYKLDGLDNDWVDAGARRVAYFSHIPPGEYTFHVIAANSDGVWNTQGAIIRITIHPHFWRTWWFLSLVIVSLAGLAFLAHRRRVSALKRAHAAQEAFSQQLIASQENERKRIAAELHDSLGQNLLIIKNRALLGLTTATDAERTTKQLEEISTTTSQAIEEVREIAYALRPFQLDRLGLTKAIEAMLKKVSASSDINFSTAIDPVDNVFTKEAEINLYRIVQESINNIVKHSGATEAKVEIERDSRGVLIKIQDNGRGFLPEATTEQKSDGNGLGLTGISERARMLGGRHEIRSIPGEGTIVTIKIGIKDKLDGN